MSYHISKTIKTSLEEARNRTIQALRGEGFGVLAEIDMQATLKNKLDVEVGPYIILGACNPEFAYKAVLAESHIGTMLPCNIILRESENGEIEVSAVDPQASMQAIENNSLGSLAGEVKSKLERVIFSL